MLSISPIKWLSGQGPEETSNLFLNLSKAAKNCPPESHDRYILFSGRQIWNLLGTAESKSQRNQLLHKKKTKQLLAQIPGLQRDQ